MEFFMNETDIKNIKGLSTKEVAVRLQKFGFNELPTSKKRNILGIILDVIKEPMFMLLIAGGFIYLLLGDTGEALLLLFFVFVIMSITIYQENKTEHALEALRDLSSPRALVIREGDQKRIAGRDVVVDDVMILREGDRVPADARIIWQMNLSVDESLLTGEAAPVRKKAEEQNIDCRDLRPGGHDLPVVYSGTLVVGGQGIAKVVATGPYTEIGKIGKSLQTIQETKTPLQLETGRIVKYIFIFAVILSLTLVLVNGLRHGDWLNGILAGISLAMAMLPEEFPVVLTIFLALGAWRISKNKVLTRKVSAVETLGAATVLCADKTGTLTQNKMRIAALVNGNDVHKIVWDKKIDLPEAYHELIEYGILASKKDPFDPMEKALNELGTITLQTTEHLHADWPLIQEYPLSHELLALSHAWKIKDKQTYIIAAKGAPEAIMDLCHLSVQKQKSINKKVEELADQGLRILGVAKAICKDDNLPRSQHDFEFIFIGLIGWQDPIRDTVPGAVETCYQAGIRVIMITGDYPATARNIAEQIGLKNSDQIITGPELDNMSDGLFQEKVKTVSIFARVVPEQKLRIVNALKSGKQVVGMTGDGVNDAPALKSAHIGIAMGERGTDVAREASDLVLLNDDFSSIVAAIRMGRRIFDNLRKAMSYIICVHIPIAGIAILPVILGWPILLYPVHIVFLELIIDPACSVVFESEPEEKNIMQRPPRDSHAPLFSRKLLFLSLLQGLFALCTVTFIFRMSLINGYSEKEARTIAFITLIIANLSLILTNRTWNRSIISSIFTPNKSLVFVFSGAILFLFCILYVPLLQNIFHFSFMHIDDVFVSLLAGLLSIGWFEVLRIVQKNIKKTSII
ncbi:MAG: cation-translocating P-type ATPase [Candidatus Margulisbacteria bacterium]|nr:cation-translocating P-type ATPase [Candidatus Margulisiibacteriota bacterium]